MGFLALGAETLSLGFEQSLIYMAISHDRHDTQEAQVKLPHICFPMSLQAVTPPWPTIKFWFAIKNLLIQAQNKFSAHREKPTQCLCTHLLC
jgi:hypothetical protein